MKKTVLLFSFLFAVSFLYAQQFPIKQTIGSNGTIVVSKGGLGSDSGYVNAIYPDTATANLGNISYYPNAQIVAGNMLWIRNSTATAWIKMGAIALTNGLISTGGISLVDSTVTIQDTIKWSLNGIVYFKITPSIFIINTADSGYYRRDLIYADTTGNLFKITGTEDSVIAITPALPKNSVSVTVIDVYGKKITVPILNIIGSIPTLQQTTNQGNSTTNQIVSNYNNGGYGFQVNIDKNGYGGFGSTNTNSGNGAASGSIAYNDLNHFLQWYQGSSNNAYVKDGALVRGSGSGGIKIVADSGKIVFQEGLINTSHAPDTVGYFDTDKKLVLSHYKNNGASDSVLSTDVNGKLIFKKATGIDSSAYRTITLATDSSYALFGDLKNRKDTLVIQTNGVVEGHVQSVTGLNTDNTDSFNPIIKVSVDGSTITGNGTPANPLTASGTVTDGLVSTGGITLAGNTVTVLATTIWRINAITYTKATNTVFTIANADSGYYRRDLIYADTSGNILKIQGIEDTLAAVAPTLPSNTVQIAIVDVYGTIITPPTASISSNYWATKGNAIYNDTSKLGTTTYKDLNIVTNNVTRETISKDGNIIFANPAAINSLSLFNTWSVQNGRMSLSSWGGFYPNWQFSLLSQYDNTIYNGQYTGNLFIGWGGTNYYRFNPTQLTYGNNTISNPRSSLLINSTLMGVTIPRMTTSQKNIMSGVINVSITNQGSGYTSAPTVVFSNGGTGAIQATATATLTADKVTNITMLNNGLYYSTPTVTLTGGGGTGATVTANFFPTLEGTIVADTTAHSVSYFNGVSWNNSITASGTATLVSGTVIISTTLIKTGAKIFVSVNTPSGTQGFLSAPTASIINNTSFVINSTSASDNSTVNWQIINP